MLKKYGDKWPLRFGQFEEIIKLTFAHGTVLTHFCLNNIGNILHKLSNLFHRWSTVDWVYKTIVFDLVYKVTFAIQTDKFKLKYICNITQNYQMKYSRLIIFIWILHVHVVPYIYVSMAFDL